MVLQSAFERMVRDVPRDRMPPGACWGLKDWIPGEKGAPAARRGGWAYASPNLTTINANVTYVSSVVYAPSLTPPLVCVGRSAAATRLFTVTDTSTASDKGATDFPVENPKFYRGLVILCDWDGTSSPSSWDGTTLSTTLSGSPPSGSRSCAYKDHFVLAGSSTNAERMWFSAAGNPTSWDLTSGYLDTTGPITGLHAFRDMILIFHEGTMEKLLGSIPPPGSDMTRGPLFDTGTKYPGSITGSDSFCCFANASSVYMTDGNELVDLAADGGMRSYWQSLFGTTGRIVSGVFARGWYFVSVASASTLGATPTHLATFMINVQTRAWVELGNVKMFGAARALGDKEELYWGSMTEARVNTLTGIFDGTNKNDGDGTAVTPTLETPYYNVGQSKGRWRNTYVTYDMSDAATDNPTMALSYILDPDDTSYTAVVGQDGNAYPLAETTEQTRVRRQVGKATFGAAFKLVQSNASGKTMLRRLEAELHAREESRV